MRHRILVVDDDDSIRKLLVAWCMHLGHVVVGSSNGYSALEMLATFIPDLIITDLSMPVMSGFEFIEHVRNNARFRQTKIIILSGTDPVFFAAINQFAVSAILAKPIRFKHLQLALHGNGSNQ